MLDSYTFAGRLIFAILFIASGTHSLLQKRITFRFQKACANPSFVRLNGTPAIIYGISGVVGGMTVVIPLLHTYFSGQRLSTEVQTLTGIAGFGLAVLGFGLACVVQLSNNWDEKLGRDAEKRKRDDDIDPDDAVKRESTLNIEP